MERVDDTAVNGGARSAIFDFHDEPLSDHGRHRTAIKEAPGVDAISEMFSQERVDGMVFGLRQRPAGRPAFISTVLAKRVSSDGEDFVRPRCGNPSEGPGSEMLRYEVTLSDQPRKARNCYSAEGRHVFFRVRLSGYLRAALQHLETGRWIPASALIQRDSLEMMGLGFRRAAHRQKKR